MWSIWNQRNSHIWSNKHFLDPLQVLSQATIFLNQWLQVHSASLTPPFLDPSIYSWQNPQQGRLKCNLNATYYSQRRYSTFGALICGDDGLFKIGVHESLLFSLDPTIDEALALRKVLEWFQRLGMDQVNVETDS